MPGNYSQSLLCNPLPVGAVGAAAAAAAAVGRHAASVFVKGGSGAAVRGQRRESVLRSQPVGNTTVGSHE